jgi:proline iminopeptidase
MTPDAHTIEEKMIEVGDGHTLYAQLWGNPKAKTTVIFLHGGPGGGVSDGHKSVFDPKRRRVIFFDQRGAGKSLPYGYLIANTTDHLVEDINKVADEFGIKSFGLVGGSWGSTLALAYGIAHPIRLEFIIIRAIFTARKREIDYLEKGGFRDFFPEVWEEYQSSVPAKHQENPGEYHYPRIFGKDKQAAKESAYAYYKLEFSLLRLDDRAEFEKFEDFDPAGITIECFYISQGCFMPEGHIMKNAHKITAPVYLVQGRYDAICPPITAYELSKKLPDGRLIWTTAGHSGGDRAIWDSVRSILLSQ